MNYKKITTVVCLILLILFTSSSVALAHEGLEYKISKNVVFNIENGEKLENVTLLFKDKNTHKKVKIKTYGEESFYHEIETGTYEVSIYDIDGKYRADVKDNEILIDIDTEEIDITFTNIKKDTFLVNFIKNNTVILVLLAGCTAALLINKKRQEVIN